MPNNPGRYWLDADVFIQSKNFHYGFDIAPGFWSALESAASSGLVCSPKRVYDDLMEYKPPDELTQWAQVRSNSGLFVEADEAVQLAFRDVAGYVVAEYQPAHAAHFLSGSDPWLVAHARADNGIVVTGEARIALGALRVKIPNVCNHFGTECITSHELLRRLGVKLVLK